MIMIIIVALLFLGCQKVQKQPERPTAQDRPHAQERAPR
jgi:PBP1b-binding outer membrane lipoprotein LpoB